MALAVRASRAMTAGSAFRTTSRATLFGRAGASSSGNARKTLKTLALSAGAVTIGAGGVLLYALEKSAAHATEFIVHPMQMPWSHGGYFEGFDMKSVRRGWEVYKQVCRSCHSLKYLYFRCFVNTFLTEEEAKETAAEFTVKDTDDNGQVIERPAIINDKIPSPYANVKAAKAANGGAEPPDLTLMSLARHGGDDYLFCLLTGYFDAPAGVSVDDGKAYNPYFPGGVIAMPQQLYDEGVEYSDGTAPTQSQQAKDVITFLHWCAEPYYDTRKRWALKVLCFMPFLMFFTIYMKRHYWTFIKSQKFAWKTVRGREPPTPPKT